MSYYYKIEQVREVIARNSYWLSILNHFGPELEEALRKPGRHVRCPVHGGKHGDGFRLFKKDAHTTGGGICNTCGPRNDGFELLMWLRNWSFKECLTAIGDYVGAPRHEAHTAEPGGAFVPKARKPVEQDASPAVRQFRGKGIVLDFGRARYEHKENTSASFFITLENREGKERDIWGVDLERSIADKSVGKGDLVALYYLGRKAVTVVEPVIDSDGVVVEEKTITTHRNEWEIVIEKRAQGSVPKAVEHRQVSNGVPEAVAAPERETMAPAERPVVKESEEAGKVIPISTPDWLAEAQQRMERNAASMAKSGAKAATKITALWDDCVPLSSSAAVPARSYFEKRGFAATYSKIAEEDDLRFHPDLPYYQEDEEGKVKLLGKFPAIVASIRDVEGNILTLHRTYLSKLGEKAKVPDAKKMMSVPDGVDINGGSIQLGEDVDGVLGVAEGLETALSAFRATGISTWSTVNAQMMKTIELPDHVHTVVVWADLDISRTGEKAALSLKERLRPKGVRVIVATPQCSIPKRAKSVDWNDVLLEKGLLGFPNPVRLRKFLGIDASNEVSTLNKVFC